MNKPPTNNKIKSTIRKGINKYPNLKKNKLIQDILYKHIDDNVAESYKYFRRKEEEFINKVITHTILEHVTKKNINDFNEDEQAELISIDPCLFINIEDKTYKLALEAIKKQNTLIKFIPDNFKTSELCREALVLNDYALKYIKPHNLPKDDYIYLITQAISKRGIAIQFIPPEYQTNSLKELAVINEPEALRYINNPTTKLCINTIKKFRYAYVYIPEYMCNSKELIRALIDEGWLFIVEYINEYNKQIDREIDKLKDRQMDSY